MYRLTMRAITVASTLAGLLVSSAPALAATRSFLTVRDDGTISAKKLPSPFDVTQTVMKSYEASGLKRPEVVSVWTTFPTNDSQYETLFDPLSNDVAGIGLEKTYDSDDGTGRFESDYPPTRAILLHNDVTALAARAKVQQSEVDGLARYLFLLELSHLWGPAARVPPTDGGPAANGLMGFSFHWSFWMDAGGSPVGGNPWKDNGDGTFTVAGQSPKTVKFSMLDLYLMGLADPSEVPPFGLLENVVPPEDKNDPFFQGLYSAKSFPWFGTEPFTAKATRRTFTIEQIIAATGTRAPARANPTMSLGIILMVKPDATDEQIAKLEADFEPIAASLAPAYNDATRGRGTLTNLTVKDDTPIAPDAGVETDGGTPPAAAPPESSSSDGCGVTPNTHGSMGIVGLMAAAFLLRRRLARSRR